MPRPSRRRRRSRGARPGGVAWLVLALAAVAVIAGLWWLARQQHPERPRLAGTATESPAGVTPRPPAEERRTAAPPATPSTAPETAPEGGEQVAGRRGPPGHVALVVDDLGRSLEEVAQLEALGVPISYAVLPFEARTAEVVRHLRGQGHELLLHLPMEPANGNDPGPGALRSSMTPRQLRRATARALAEVPGAVGVNNHMGSHLTSDPRAMDAILSVLDDRRLFFLDSRTSAGTVGFARARERGLPAAERQVFLDPDPDPAAVRAQFARLLETSRERGAAIAIGHPLPSTLAVLAEEVPRAREEGFVFVPVSYLLERTGGPE